MTGPRSLNAILYAICLYRSVHGPPGWEKTAFSQLDLVGAIRFHYKQHAVMCECNQPFGPPSWETILLLIVRQTSIVRTIQIHNVDLKFRTDTYFRRRILVPVGIENDPFAIR